ncbi:MAG: DUF11 domain-containing protein [Pseudomonadales bacterium]|nr:DUF11 domain-containing protein [Pseudomonadales bacterium]
MKTIKYPIGIISFSACLSTATFAATDAQLENFFNTNINPQMQLCGTCHIPGGLADIEDGNGFILYSDRSHYESFNDAWAVLGEGVSDNPLLTMNSDPALNHTGFQNWPTTSAIYSNVEKLLGCWDEPTLCTISPTSDNADLSVLMSGNNGENNDGVIRYTITVANSGPDTADAIEITHQLPSLVTLNEVMPSSIAFTMEEDEVTFYLDSLTMGSSQNISVAVNTAINNNAIMTFTSSVSAITEDTNTANNTSAASFGGGLEINNADLSISMTGNNGKNEAGVISYSIDLHNAGPHTANALIITHELPTKVSLSSVAPSSIAYTSENELVTIFLDSLASGARQSINITVNTPSNNKDKMDFTASVSAETEDPNLVNNSSETKFGGSLGWMITAIFVLFSAFRYLREKKATEIFYRRPY